MQELCTRRYVSIINSRPNLRMLLGSGHHKVDPETCGEPALLNQLHEKQPSTDENKGFAVLMAVCLILGPVLRG
jgi:hypothetical protein